MSKRTFTDEFALLTAIVPWAYQRDHTTIADVMANFGLTKKEALALLRPASEFEVQTFNDFANFGYVLLPLDSDHLGFDEFNQIDLTKLEPSQIYMHFDMSVLLDKPLRLSVSEATGLLLVCECAMSVPGADQNGALASGLAKVHEEFKGKVELSATMAKPRWSDELTAAVENHHTIRMRYDSRSLGEVVELAADPLRMWNLHGHWYLLAVPEGDDDVSKYRLSRIDEVVNTGEKFKRDYTYDESTFPEITEYASEQRVVLSIPQNNRYIVERYPHVSLVDDEGDRIVAEYNIRSSHILGLMLMLLGEGTRVLNPDELPDSFLSAGRDAALQILAMYEH